MSLHRKDLSNEKNPNPDKDQPYQQPELREETIEGRSFAGTSYAADERHQADRRNSGPPERGNRTDDVQHSDRTRLEAGSAAVEGEAVDEDRANRAEAARSQRDVERREETGRNE